MEKEPNITEEMSNSSKVYALFYSFLQKTA